MSSGKEIHGIFTSSDATTAAAMAIYASGGVTSGNQTALTIAANQHLIITDIIVNVAAAGRVVIFLNDDGDGTPDTGETVLAATLAANGGVAKSFIVTPRTGAAGAIPYAVHSAVGVIDVTFTGRLIEA
jgi:hypothetical protein